MFAFLYVMSGLFYKGVGITSIKDVQSVRDQELLKLMLNSFLWSGDLKNAYKVAKKGVKLFPKDIFWLGKAADISLWIGKSEEAKDYYYRLYKITKEKKLRKKLIELSIELKKNWKKLVELYEKLGQPDKALKFLKNIYKKHKKVEYLKGMIKIQLLLGHTEQAFKNLNKLKDLGNLDTRYVTFLYYMLDSLYKLKRYGQIIKDRASMKSFDYWKILSDLAWNLRDYKNSVYASRVLITSGKGRDVDYERLIIPLEKKYFERLKFHKYIWFYYAGSYLKLGEKDKAVKIYQEAIKYNPENTDFIVALLWTIIDIGDEKKLKRYIKKYEYIAKIDKKLNLVYGSAYSLLQDSLKSLYYLGKELRKNPDDPDTLIIYGDVIDLSGRTEQAYHYRFKAWKIDPSLLQNRDFLKDIIYLSFYFVPPDGIKNLLKNGKKYLRKKDYYDLLITWFLMRDLNIPAEYIMNRFKTGKPWMILNIALKNWDKEKINTLLEKKRDRLSIRDRRTGLTLSCTGSSGM